MRIETRNERLQAPGEHSRLLDGLDVVVEDVIDALVKQSA